MLKSAPPTPPMSSSELNFRQYGLAHLNEAASKVCFHQGGDSGSNFNIGQNIFLHPSTPCLSSPESQFCQDTDGYFQALNDGHFGMTSNNQSTELDSLSQSTDSQETGQISRTGKYQIEKGQRQVPTDMHSSPPSDHYSSSEKMSYIEDQLYKGPLFLQLDDIPSPLPVPVVTVKRPRKGVAIVKLPESGKTMARVRKNPRIRKAPAEKVERPKVPKLERPLSQLTDEYNHLPIRDMESWVNRPASVRKEEVDKRGGYITRPMNSFMLYRSAYAERTKLWCLQNNHQVVSSVSGESWPLEPDAVRARYNELARIERINHQSAHPGYKFSPSKTQTSRKRKGAKADEQSDESDVEDMVNDAEYVESPNEKRRRSQRNLKKEEKGQDFEPGAIAVNNKYYDLLVAGEGGASRSSFAATNPGKTPPVCMGSTDMTGQYYQTTVQASRATPVPNGNAIIEDVTIQKTLAPGRSSNLGLSQMWMTSGMYASSLGWNPEEVEDAMHENCKVDPMLLVQDMGDGHYGSYDNQPGVYTLPDDIDEGFEMGGFDIDPLFQTDCHNVFEGYPPQMNGGANCGDHGGYGPSSIDSAIDVQSMSAYQDTIRGYIDGDDAWTIVKDESCGAGLKYDEWLQE